MQKRQRSLLIFALQSHQAFVSLNKHYAVRQQNGFKLALTPTRKTLAAIIQTTTKTKK